MDAQTNIEGRERLVVEIPVSLKRAVAHEAVEIGSQHLVVEIALRMYFKLHEKEIA